jgi:hypothetical protein
MTMSKYRHSPEVIERIRQAKLGRTDSPETREKKRVARLGDLNPMRRADVRAVASRSQTIAQNRPDVRARNRERMLGTPPRAGSGYAKWYDYERRSGEKIRVSTYELLSCQLLDELNFDWEYVGTGRVVEHRLLLSDGKLWSPDFWIPNLKLYVDVKGFWRVGDRARLALEEYPDRVRVLVGETYLEQLRALLEENE